MALCLLLCINLTASSSFLHWDLDYKTLFSNFKQIYLYILHKPYHWRCQQHFAEYKIRRNIELGLLSLKPSPVVWFGKDPLKLPPTRFFGSSIQTKPNQLELEIPRNFVDHFTYHIPRTRLTQSADHRFYHPLNGVCRMGSYGTIKSN